MRSSIITMDQFCIEQKQEGEQPVYVLWKGKTALARADNVEYVAQALMEHFKAQRLPVMQRVNNPKIRITMTIR